MFTQELMAENVALMESQLSLIKEIEKRQEEINTLKEYIKAQKKYYQYLEENQHDKGEII